MAISPGRTMARRKRSEHYVNNKEFLAALIKYREDVEIAKLREQARQTDKKIAIEDKKLRVKEKEIAGKKNSSTN